MHRIQRKGLAVASAVAMLLALGACGRSADDPAAQGRSGAAAPGTGAPTGTKRETGNASAKADVGMDRAAHSTRSMGAAAAPPTREFGASAAANVDDATITARVNAALAADQELSALGMDVDTQNGVVTLSGPAPTASAKERASEVARTVKGVTSVNNQLTLKAG